MAGLTIILDQLVKEGVITPIKLRLLLFQKAQKPVRRNKDGTPRKKPKKAKPKIPKNEGYFRTAKFRLETTPWQEQLLLSYSGTARAVYNTILYHAKARYSQRQAEISYGIPEEQLTELVPLTQVDLQNFVNTMKPVWFPWHSQVSKFAFDTGVRSIVKAFSNFFTNPKKYKYPKYKKKPKHEVTADLSVSMVDVNAKSVWSNCPKVLMRVRNSAVFAFIQQTSVHF